MKTTYEYKERQYKSWQTGKRIARSMVALVPNDPIGRRFIRDLKVFVNHEKRVVLKGRGPRILPGEISDLPIKNAKFIAVYLYNKQFWA